MAQPIPMPPVVPRSKDFVILGLLAIVGGLTVVAWRQRLELERVARVGTTAAVAIRTAGTRTLAVLPRNLTADESSGRRSDEGRESPPAAAARGQGANGRRASALARLADNPDFRRALELQRQALLDTRFAALFRVINLSEDELAAFKRLLVEKESVALDVVAVSETLPEGPLSPATLRASVTAARAQVEDAIRTSLGGERYAVYREFERTQAQRATVAQLEQRLSYSSAPLSPSQAESLVKIMVAHAPVDGAPEAVPAVSVVIGAGGATAMPVVQTAAAVGRVGDEVVSAAQTILSAPQIEALRQIHVEQVAAEQAFTLIRDTMLRDDGPSSVIWPLLQ